MSRRFGWDCHGLPVEFEIDKKLGIKTKDDVMAMVHKRAFASLISGIPKRAYHGATKSLPDCLQPIRELHYINFNTQTGHRQVQRRMPLHCDALLQRVGGDCEAYGSLDRL